MNRFLSASLTAGLAWLAGCGMPGALPEGSVVLTQTPVLSEPPTADNVLDARYPAGSRVVIARPPFDPRRVKLLSRGLHAAGDPVLSYDAQRVLFVGKPTRSSDWQIYEVSVKGGSPRPLTSVKGGAMNPALLPNGDLVFSSPVPKAGEAWKTLSASAIYAQSPGQAPRRLTYGSSGAAEPTVLADGRILFVAPKPPSSEPSEPHLALFTMNNDGTEMAGFAAVHDGAAYVRRPRDLGDGRIAFLAGDSEMVFAGGIAESVRLARPFDSRTRLLPLIPLRCRSVESGGDARVLVALEHRGHGGRDMRTSSAIFRLDPSAETLGAPLFDDLERNDLEALLIRARPRPLGHISAMVPSRSTGTILCLDANYTTYRLAEGRPAPAATTIRVLGLDPRGGMRVLGDLPVLADGSLMFEVPTDTPLGFEALNERGLVLRAVRPFIWLRPGENRTCVGCHEGHNRSPRNARPLAVKSEPLKLGAPVPALLANKGAEP